MDMMIPNLEHLKVASKIQYKTFTLYKNFCSLHSMKTKLLLQMILDNFTLSGA